MLKIILASGSPRRRELLERVGIPFEIAVSGTDESMVGYDDATRYAMDMAVQKAKSVAATCDGSPFPILGADTVVSIHNHILGKPANAEEARRMLQRLSGHWHEVITGLALVWPETGRTVSVTECTRVKMRTMDSLLIDRYLQTGEPFDKAGAYGIQGMGGLLVERVEGCYYNVMGLPLFRLSALLEAEGFPPFSWNDMGSMR